MIVQHTSPAPPPAPAGFVRGVWNPEDLIQLPDSPWVIISAMRSSASHGALLAARVDGDGPARELAWAGASEQGRVSALKFDPHGIAVRRLNERAYELLVIDHGGGEAVDRLRLEIGEAGPRITHGERIVQPEGTSGNALAFMPDGGWVLTSMFDPRDAAKLDKFARGEVTGGVWRWRPAEGWSRFGALALSGANGIAASADGSNVFVSEWSARRVWKLDASGAPIAHVNTRFLPDNLRWTAQGVLLLAGQAAKAEAVFGCVARGERCPLAFEVAELEPARMNLTSLIAADEGAAAEIGFGGATGAIAVGAQVWVGSFTGERIAKFAR